VRRSTGHAVASLDVLAGADGDRPESRPVEVAAIVRASADLVAPALARRSIDLEVSVEEPLEVRCRPDELTQVVANLLQNAVRYTQAGGCVRVTAERTADGVAVRVANTGPGIPDADLPHVWEATASRSPATAREAARGGLAIVKRLVEDAGGRVVVTSDADWTTFWFSLPA
jgi:signal transduction histidine kinase